MSTCIIPSLLFTLGTLPLHVGGCPRVLPEDGWKKAEPCDHVLLPEPSSIHHQDLTKGMGDGKKEGNQLLQMEGTEWTRAGVSPLGSNGRNMSTDPKILLVRDVLYVGEMKELRCVSQALAGNAIYPRGFK